jgi:hypothetical protein
MPPGLMPKGESNYMKYPRKIMFLSMIVLAFGGLCMDSEVHAQSTPNLNLKPINPMCGMLLDKVITNGGRATIVTNNSKTQVVHYLTGTLSSSGSSASGQLTELKSDRRECLESTGGEGGFATCRADQPFSIKQPDQAQLTIAKPVSKKATATITWPGGGVTTDELACTASGTYLWHRENITAVLVVTEGPRAPR